LLVLQEQIRELLLANTEIKKTTAELKETVSEFSKMQAK
jgi:hypothetical protein